MTHAALVKQRRNLAPFFKHTKVTLEIKRKMTFTLDFEHILPLS